MQIVDIQISVVHKACLADVVLSVQNLITESSYFEGAISSIQDNMGWLELNAADACAWLAAY